MIATDSPTGARRKNHYTQSDKLKGFSFEFLWADELENALYKYLKSPKSHRRLKMKVIQILPKTSWLWQTLVHAETAADSDRPPSSSEARGNPSPKSHGLNHLQTRGRNKRDRNPTLKSATLKDSISQTARAFYHNNSEMSSGCMVLSKKYYRPKNMKRRRNEYAKKKK